MKYLRRTTMLSLTSLALAGCGGGSSNVDNQPTSSITLTGTAATGAGMSGATVTAKCASGTGTTSQVTGTDGNYTVTITSGALPCVLEASNGTTTLHSVANTSTANITPLTELLVAQLTGIDPATYMSSVDTSTLSSTVTTDSIGSAQTKVLSVLEQAGLDTSAITDVVSGSLTAGSGTGYDGVLDNLASTLSSSGSTLPQLTATVANSSPANTTSTNSGGDNGTSALAPELLLKPAAASCQALRATDYWAVFSSRVDGDAVQKFRVSIDTNNGNSASIIFFNSADGNTLSSTVYNLTATAEACHFTSSAGDIVVSPSGIVAGRSTATEAFLAVPVQTHTLAEMEGNWNIIAGDTAGDGDTGWTYGYATMAITTSNGSGHEQITQGCWFESTGTSTCTDIDDETKSFQRPFNLDSNGSSFTNHSVNDAADGGPWSDRFFVYKNGKGDYFAISSNVSTPDSSGGDGSLGYATKVRTLSLPSLNSNSLNWNIAVNWTSGLAPSAIDLVSHTVTVVDSGASSFTRLTGAYGSSATHAETVLLNSPFAGFSFRDYVANAAVNGGGTTAVRKNYTLKGGSSGVSVSLQPYQDNTKLAKIVVSVAKPSF